MFLKYVAVAALTLVAAPSFAATPIAWSIYQNDRYGYEIAIPPGFRGQGEPDAHDGQVFNTADGKAELTVWGGFLVDTTLADDFTNGKGDHMGKGWSITYQAATPGWTSYSGTRAQQVLYVREITSCSGQQFATFEFTYPSTSINAMKPVVEKLVGSLKQDACPD